MDNLKESTHFRAQHYICNHCEFNSQTRSTGHKIEGILHALLFRESEKYYKQIANQVRDGIEMYHYNSYPHNVIASFISLLFCNICIAETGCNTGYGTKENQYVTNTGRLAY